MNRNFAWSRPAMAALLVAASATTLSAQSTAQVPADEINAIEMRATDNLKDPGRWDRAASLLRRAADLRPAGDPQAVRNLIKAARISFYDGDETQALRDFEAAGQRAMAMGDVIVAANAFTDAAWVANGRGLGARAHDLLNRAQLLATSPLIPEAARDILKTRWATTSPQQ